MVEGGFKVFGDFTGEDVWVGEISRIFKAFVYEPEDVEVYFVPLQQFFNGEGSESLGFLSFMSVLGIVAADKVLEVLVFEGIGFEGEVHVSAEVVYPELVCPGLFTGRLAVKEEDVSFNTLGVEYPRGKPQEGVDITLMEQSSSDCLPCTAFE